MKMTGTFRKRRVPVVLHVKLLATFRSFGNMI